MKTISQSQKILNELIKVFPKGITALDIFKAHGGLRAAARIYDLKNAGNAIVCEQNPENNLYYYRLLRLSKMRIIDKNMSLNCLWGG